MDNHALDKLRHTYLFTAAQEPLQPGWRPGEGVVRKVHPRRLSARLRARLVQRGDVVPGRSR